MSGGNQQKIVLGKWLANQPKLLILDEPTRGIDVGAKAEIHRLMGELAAQGVAILMISSELPEVLGMSDRVLVMREGRLVAEFARADATPEAVGAAMMGSHGAERGEGGMSALATFTGDPARRRRAAPARLAGGVAGVRHHRPRRSWSASYNPRFLATRNLTDILLGNAYIAVAAIGMSMVIVSGNIDISVGALIGVLATISGIAGGGGRADRSLAWLAPLVVGVARHGVAGRRRRLSAAFPSIVVTLGMLSILKGGLISVTGGRWITDLPQAFHLADIELFGVLPMPVLIMVRATIAGRAVDALFGRAAARSTRPAAMPRRRGSAACRRGAPS